MIEAVIDPRIGAWVVAGINGATLDDLGEEFLAVGFARDGKPTGGVVFTEHNKQANSVNVLIRSASRMWLKPEVLNTVFDVAYNQIGIGVIRVAIKEGNKRSEQLCKKLGFRKEGVHRQAWDGKTNMLTYSMLKSECKYLEPRNG